MTSFDRLLHKFKTRYMDGFGIVTQLQAPKDNPDAKGFGDPGDSAQRTGMYYYGLALHDKPDHVGLMRTLMLLEDPNRPGEGRYRRTPQDGYWGARVNTMSRDQIISLLIALGEYDLTLRLNELTWALIKRCGFCWNTRHNWVYPTKAEQDEKARRPNWEYKWKLPDFFHPQHWSALFRANKWRYAYPLLCICDFGLVVTATIRVLKSIKYPQKALPDNFVMMMIQAQRNYPTPFVYLAKYIYKYRMAAGRLTKPIDPNKNSAQIALDWQFRGEYPPMNELYELPAKIYFYK